MDAIFESNFATTCNNNGYQQTFPNYVKSLKDALIKSSAQWAGPIYVDLNVPPGGQLRGEVSGVINLVNEMLVPS
jgi:hypothetical protein